MNPRRLIGLFALVALILTGVTARVVTGIHQDDWPILLKVLFVVAVCGALFAAFYDSKNFPEKSWDFNPKRGVLYFFMGWIIFPVLIGIDALGNVTFSWSGMVVGTFAMSLFIGILGTFTENVGV